METVPMMADGWPSYVNLGQPPATLTGGECERLKPAHAYCVTDLGSGAGYDGGRLVFEGTPAELDAACSTLAEERLPARAGMPIINIMSSEIAAVAPQPAMTGRVLARHI
jgi:excinuclease UvrABC ATPase subunit